MLRVLRLLVWPSLFLIPMPSVANTCIWYSDTGTVNQVDTSTNKTLVTINLQNARHLAMNSSHCGVWVVADKRLYRFDGAGAQVSNIALNTVNSRLDDVGEVIADPYDDTLWISDDRAIFHLNSNGALLNTLNTPSKARSVAVSLDGNIWVLGNKQLWHYSPKGSLLETIDVHKLVSGEPKSLILDDLRKTLWVTGEKKLTRLPLGQFLGSPLSIDFKEEPSAITLNPLNGDLWLATKDILRSYTFNGRPGVTASLRDSNRRVEQLTFDPVSQSVWAGAENSANRFTAEGVFIAGWTANGGVTSIAAPIFSLRPLVSLVQPGQDAMLNNAQPAVRYSFDALCNGVTCGFAPEYFATYTLRAMLNQNIISRFVFDKTVGTSTYESSVRLPEGKNVLSAQVQNSFGRVSDVVENTFIVDTVAPKISSLVATEGSVSAPPHATLEGIVDDVTAAVVVEGLGQVTDTKIRGNTLVFSFPVTLALGVNIFKVTAIDKASNTSTQTVQIINRPRQDLLSIQLLSPFNGATVSDSTVLVRGTYMGPVNTGFSVNGVTAFQDGQNFYAVVPLQTGNNVLSVKATTILGASVIENLNVISEGPSPVEISASFDNNILPTRAKFAVQNNTDKLIQNLEADFDGDGVVDFNTSDPTQTITFTYAVPGTYQANFKITDGYGATVNKRITIVVEDPAQIDRILRTQWTGLIEALSAGDKEKSVAFFNQTSKKKYGEIFDKLMPQMANIFRTASSPQKMSVTRRVGEYAVNRIAGVDNKIFLVYFLRDDDGVWRIDSL